MEVKSSGYNTHTSLDEFCKKYSKRVKERYLIYTKDLRKDNETMLVPMYMVPFCNHAMYPSINRKSSRVYENVLPGSMLRTQTGMLNYYNVICRVTKMITHNVNKEKAQTNRTY